MTCKARGNQLVKHWAKRANQVQRPWSCSLWKLEKIKEFVLVGGGGGGVEECVIGRV